MAKSNNLKAMTIWVTEQERQFIAEMAAAMGISGKVFMEGILRDGLAEMGGDISNVIYQRGRKKQLAGQMDIEGNVYA